MKKIFLGTAILFLFVLTISILQISCSKSQAQQNRPSSPTTQLGKIVYGLFGSGTLNGIYTANYDGTNQTQIPITLPGTYFISNNDEPSLSPDGSKIFFIGIEHSTGVRSMFSCDINGANLTRIIDYPIDYQPKLGGAY